MATDDVGAVSPGDSPEQRVAEIAMVATLSEALGCALSKWRIALPSGGYLEFDACNEGQTVLCEA
jgi:hypothetical protein